MSLKVVYRHEPARDMGFLSVVVAESRKESARCLDDETSRKLTEVVSRMASIMSNAKSEVPYLVVAYVDACNLREVNVMTESMSQITLGLRGEAPSRTPRRAITPRQEGAKRGPVNCLYLPEHEHHHHYCP